MSCCACAGSCCHVGPHSFCADHSPQQQTLTPNPYWWWQFITAPTRQCSPHCYCQDDPVHPDHYLCCACFSRLHKKFISAPQEREPQ